MIGEKEEITEKVTAKRIFHGKIFFTIQHLKLPLPFPVILREKVDGLIAQSRSWFEDEVHDTLTLHL